ncbi:hypothetical protein [Flavobacterium sp. UGB4466]|uniref:hypothetical protein n=1 Tax=Flavobacterium sp. UGB4466 TaxID=2730889 RepID=UPI00192ACACA|nr:hypothetical protein [Flavobacterium sp. UGB4466]
MKVGYIILVLCCMVSCKEKFKIETKIEEDKKDEFSELKADIGLPESYADTLSLLSYMPPNDSIDYDKKFLKVDYKEKLDSLYEVIDEELNIIGFESHFINDTRGVLIQLKQNDRTDINTANRMWSVSYGTNYREYRNDKNAFKRIEQMIYKRRYEELLIYNFHLRSNLTRWIVGPYTISYRKRLKDVMPKKALDSMYPSKKI